MPEIGIGFGRSFRTYKDIKPVDRTSAFEDIYQSNFFKEVTISIDNSILNINVVENPIIDKLDIKGTLT